MSSQQLLLLVSVLLSALLQVLVKGEDIVGCGGFVQSTVPISFEKVEVRLHTKQGSFKFKTECAPNNGYFLVAIYDKGEYILQIAPPEGWGFAPQQIPLKIDGITDPCSKGEDLNFVFTGFSVMGQIISLGREQGPSSVNVKLLTSDEESREVAANTTNEVGNFLFTDVMPGTYMLKASHSTWVFRTDTVPVTVVDDNAVLSQQIEVAGYDVKGHVLSSGEPIQGVSFILYATDVDKKDMVSSCTDNISADIVNAIKLEDSNNALCIVTSAKDGSFVFPTVPSGNYVLVPYYSAQNIVFDILPSKLSFAVNYRSVVLKTPFQVYGFSVQGRILDNIGNGISDVNVLAVSEAGEERMATTQQDGGRFLMENVTTGGYTFKATKEHYYFDEERMHISPNTPHLNDIVAKEFSVCGNIHVPLVPTGVRQINQHKVLLQPQDSTSSTNTNIRTTSPDRNGNFCFRAGPGLYKLEVPVIETERKLGFLLTPNELNVEVKNAPILDLKFTQFLGTVSGVVSCMEDCADVTVHITPLEQQQQQSTDKVFAKMVSTGVASTFTFTDILPGKYKVVAARKKWCFDPNGLEVIVNDAHITDVKFEHSGYYLKSIISHNITLNFALENSNDSVGSFELKQGTNQFCLKKPGVYALTPRSCYQFQQEVYQYDTSQPKSLQLNVHMYKLNVTVNAAINVQDIKLLVESLTSGIKETITMQAATTTTTTTTGESEGDVVADSGVVYGGMAWGRLNEQFKVTPLSNEILFYPDHKVVTIQENCPGALVDFAGREGKFIEGVVSPPLSSVVVTINTKASDAYPSKTIEVHTDEQGKYRVGPVHSDLEYDINAAKAGYLITPQQEEGKFIAQKLGFITVKVSEENGAAMSQVLLSLSGGQYRNNNLTTTSGEFTFANLGPGQYFLRPMQKEYSFAPNSKMINVAEGEEVTVDVTGQRVAFSCSGILLSLSGVAEENVPIEAVGLHKCADLHESTTSDRNGFYRLRGLQPGCAYNIRMMKTESKSSPIERLAPTNQVISVQQSDTSNLKFIVFHKPTKFYLTAHIDTELEFLPSIKVLLYEENNLDTPVHTVNPGVVKYIQFPPLKPRTYVIKLQSTLSSKTHETHATSATITPDENLSKKHAKLKFEAKTKKVDMEPTQSVIALPLAVAFVFLAYNYDAVLLLVLKVNAFFQNLNKGSESTDVDSEGDDENKSSKKKRR